jgi:serine/threonine protein kinase/tetratricopeptide (TPR) repeat protein
MANNSTANYTITKLLGRGGMAEVYEAVDTKDQKNVALKLLLPHLAAEEVIRRRFLREARVGMELDHPGIVKVFDVGEAEGRPYMAMELVQGKTLEDLLKTKCFDLEQCIGISLKITGALAAAHQKKIVHRDIKPRNIMVTDTGIKIMDFGLARILETSSITDQHEIIGTLYYMSPEQTIGIKVDASSDVFSLGVVLYQMLTGQLPFAGEHPGAVIHAILYSDPLRISELGKAVPMELEKVIFKTLKKKPQARYRSASELYTDLSRMHDILQGKPVQLLATEEIFEESPRGIYSKLVGREREMAALEAALEKMMNGESSVILVSGEAGIGKSRLVWELGHKAKQKQARYMLGRCLFGERGYPYQPIIEILRDYFMLKGIKDADAVDTFIEEKAKHIAARRNIIHSLLLFQAEQPTPLVNKEQLWDTISELIKMIAQDRPVVLHLDDLHWADAPTLNLLTYLAMTTRNDRLIIIATYRPEELITAEGKRHPLQATLDMLNKEHLSCEMSLTRLDKQDTHEVVDSVFADARFPANFYDSVHQETEGNPLFVLEVLKYLQDEHAVDKDETGWHLTGPLTKLAIPDRVSDVIMHRLTKLSPESRAVLEVAAVEGYTFRSDTLCCVLEELRLKILRRLQSLESEHQLVHALEHEYQFDHGKIQETIYNALTPDLKQEYHNRIADYLITNYGNENEHAGKIAKHLIEADHEERALPYLLSAGRYAQKLYANEKALDYIQQGLDIVGAIIARNPNGEHNKYQLDLLQNRAAIRQYFAQYDEALADQTAVECLSQTINDKNNEIDAIVKQGALCVIKAEYARAMDFYDRALQKQSKLNDRMSEAKILSGIAGVYLYVGKFDDAFRYYTRALALQEELNDRRNKASTLLSLSYLYFNKGEFDSMQEACERSLKICEDLDIKDEMASVLHILGSAYYSKGYTRKAIALTERGLLINQKIGNKLGESNCLRALGMQHQTAGEYEIATNYFAKAAEINKHFWTKSNFFIYNGIAEVASGQGDFDRALEYYKKARDSQTKVAEICYTGHTLNNIAVVHFYRGDYELTLEYFRQVGFFHSRFGMSWVFAFTYGYSCMFWALFGERRKILENLNKLRDLNKTMHAIRADAWAIMHDGYLNYLEGHYDKANALLQESSKISREVTCDVAMISEALISLAKIEMARKEYVKALEVIKELLDHAITVGRKHDIARAYLIYAQHDILQKDYHGAFSHAQQSLEYADKCGMKEVIWQAHHMLAKVYLKQKKLKQAKAELNKAKAVLDVIINNLGDELNKIYINRKEVKEFYKDLKAIKGKTTLAKKRLKSTVQKPRRALAGKKMSTKKKRKPKHHGK